MRDSDTPGVAAGYLSGLTSRFELPADRSRRVFREALNAATEIISFAQMEGMDLIIMASHCRSRLGRLTQGGVCSEVVRSRVRPVLCVPLPGARVSRQRPGVLARRS